MNNTNHDNPQVKKETCRDQDTPSSGNVNIEMSNIQENKDKKVHSPGNVKDSKNEEEMMLLQVSLRVNKVAVFRSKYFG